MTNSHHSDNGGNNDAAYTYEELSLKIGNTYLDVDNTRLGIYQPLGFGESCLDIEMDDIQLANSDEEEEDIDEEDYDIIDDDDDDESATPITFRLLRIPGNEPVFEEVYRPERYIDSLHINTFTEIERLEPGMYRLLMLNIRPEKYNAEKAVRPEEGGCSCTFRILPDGSRLARPEVEGVEMAVEGAYSLHIALDLAEETGHDDIFDIYCHDSSLMMMGHDTARQPEGHTGSRVTLNVKSRLSFAEGSYFCIVARNAEPFFRINFCVDADGKALPGDTATLTPGSMEHIMVRQLENNKERNAEWKVMRNTEGCGHLMHQAVEYRRLELHNEIRNAAGANPLRRSCNHFLYGNATDVEKRTLKAFGMLVSGHCDIRITSVETLTQDKNSVDPMEDAKTAFEGEDKIVCLTDCAALLWGKGSQVARIMERALTDHRGIEVFLIGSKGTEKQLREAYPKLMELIPHSNRLPLRTSSLCDTVHGIERRLADKGIRLDDNAASALAKGIKEHMDHGTLHAAATGFCHAFVEKAVMPRYMERMLGKTHAMDSGLYERLSTVVTGDIDWQAACGEGAALDDCLAGLKALVGLDNVKRSVENLAMQVRFNAMRRHRGLPAPGVSSPHLIFTGSPGTGKTTVAKMIGSIFHSLGILSVGNVVMAERSSLVGRYIGETEAKVRQVLEQAKGNVLFIDEAYTLCDSTDDRKDYGYRVIECLLTVMGGEDPDMTVIMAGYSKEMERMMQGNQGLRGRFTHHLDFPDFSAGELMLIAHDTMKANGLAITPEAEQYMRQTVERATAARSSDFSNARWMKHYVEDHVMPRLAARLMTLTDITDEEMTTITLPDVRQAYEAMTAESPRKKAVIGFI